VSSDGPSRWLGFPHEIPRRPWIWFRMRCSSWFSAIAGGRSPNGGRSFIAFSSTASTTGSEGNGRDRWRTWFTGKQEEEADENPIEAFPDLRIQDAGERLDEKRALSNLELALHQLPLRQRQAFLLRAWEGYSVAETALSMGCSGGSVKTHYSRAIRALRHRLEEHR